MKIDTFFHQKFRHKNISRILCKNNAPKNTENPRATPHRMVFFDIFPHSKNVKIHEKSSKFHIFFKHIFYTYFFCAFFDEKLLKFHTFFRKFFEIFHNFRNFFMCFSSTFHTKFLHIFSASFCNLFAKPRKTSKNPLFSKTPKSAKNPDFP